MTCWHDPACRSEKPALVRGEFGIYPVIEGDETRYVFRIRWLRTGEWLEDGCVWTADREMAMRYDCLAAAFVALDAVERQTELFETAHNLGVCNERI